MVNAAKSNLAKAGIIRQRKDEAKKEAASAYRLELQKPEPERRSVRSIGEEYDVPPSTVWRLAHAGSRTISDFNDAKNIVSHSSRILLVQWMLHMADRALPVSRKLLKEKANALVHMLEDPEFAGVDDSWAERFLACLMCHDLSSHWSSSLTKDRASAVNPNTVASWFRAVEEHVVKPQIPVENHYGMDESNFQMSQFQKRRYYASKRARNVYSRQGGNRGSVTVIVTICGDGKTLPPTVIFKGVKLMKRWGRINPIEANISRARKGYTNKELGAAWLRDFDMRTHSKNDKPRALFLDVHSSHYSLSFLDYAVNNNIVVMGYWAHTTHLMQGLDVACFGTLKTQFEHAKSEYEHHTSLDVDGSSFLEVYASAHRETFTPETVRAAFRLTGLIPFNPNIVTAEQQAPSLELSTHGTFPVPPPSPIKAILTAFRRRHHDLPTPSPSPRHPSTFDSAMPSLVHGLASTSASFLVSDTNPFTSASQIPPPVFYHLPKDAQPTWAEIESPRVARSYEDLKNENEVLRNTLRTLRGKVDAGEEALETLNAQLLLQSMYLDEQQQQLHHQESKHRKGRVDALLQTEMGPIFTSDEFLQAAREDDERVAKAHKAKDRRGEVRKWKASEKKRIEGEYKELVEAWEGRREMLRDQGKRSGWGRRPAKPKCAPMPATVCNDGDDDLDLEGELVSVEVDEELTRTPMMMGQTPKWTQSDKIIAIDIN
ncbi:hypothetical protein Hypma_003112 [Hypsizygus marmoreus]|uniref:HTH CENPB-type domain-containing protein n=1 Tax=Hypsizygus marmoreus TaxID=39966 RepID=A0A369J4Y0_HYPMA|nr:hypothetical protein Hypma_003112 [Hypsizygus marmoreus]